MPAPPEPPVPAPDRRHTRLQHSGRASHGSGTRPVNPPLMRASTVVFDSVAQWRANRAQRQQQQVLSYGARGTATTFALEDALCELEGGARCKLFPSGLAAIAAVLLACLQAGDHVLLSDALYQPVRTLCSTLLAPRGIACEFYAADGSDIAERLRPNTRLIYAELPGSLFYEMVDLAQLAALAQRHGAWLVVDNTWASGWRLNPLALGADISILAVTKYIAGHSDLTLGAAVCNARAAALTVPFCEALGQTCSPDDAALALRGLRTLGLRLDRHAASALALARWLSLRPEVARVYHPALPGSPGHALWAAQCSGSNGLITLALHERSGERRDAFIDALALFGIGASWGGYESLAIPVEAAASRSVADLSPLGACLRLHQDLAQALARSGLVTAGQAPAPVSSTPP
jgi:cysteine-S-conjugate beta-lyase